MNRRAAIALASRVASRRCLVAALLWLSACSFAQEEQPGALKMNSCALDTDCGKDALCMEGMCVADSADVPLEIALLVTPVGGDESTTTISHPVLLERFKVEGPDDRRLALPPLVTVSGTVRNGMLGVDSSLTFTPMHQLRGVAVSSINAATVNGKSTGQDDFSVRLSSGLLYRVLVRPMDPALPPFAQEFKADGGSGINVDYAALPIRKQAFSVEGAPSDRPLLLRALDDVTGEPLSSTAEIVKGKAELLFSGEEKPYRLEIRAVESYDPNVSEASSSGIFCDDDTPMFPVLALRADSVPDPDSEGVIALQLPETKRVRYEGTVALCEDALMADAGSFEALPVTLHSDALALPDDSPWSGTFDATTSARLDGSNSLHFCVQLMEGEYDVLATPPASVPCAVFAERRPILTPDGMARSGDQLSLPKLSYLQGTVQRVNDGPLANASVEAIALGREDGIDLPAEDMSIVRYNRSRQVVTEQDGQFKVAVDLGSYDVLFKPPAASGFSWQIRHDVAVGSREQPFSTIIDMSSPVTLNGELAYANGGDSTQQPLANAEILAYAIVREDDRDERAVPIGKAVADEAGVFMLLLPQSLVGGW